MKTKLIILESIVIFLIGLVTYFYFTISKSFYSDAILSIGLATIFGMNFGLYYAYRKNRVKLSKVNHENFYQGVTYWLCYLLGLALISLFVLIGYKIGYWENIKPIIIQFLLMLIVLGNYNSIIDQKWVIPEIPLPKSNYQDKINRFSGKSLFIGGVLGIIMICILPQNYGLYIFLSVITLSSIFSFVYSRKLKQTI
jgi:VIT1/CCC1 family predicted Fe2+/Mn2+ transporter